jgi:hypothetical protein
MKKYFFFSFFCFLFCCASTKGPVELVEPGSGTAREFGTGSGSGNELGFTATVFIATVPPGAKLYMDGKPVGEANISKVKVKPGKHKMRFVAPNGKFKEVMMTFKDGDNGSQTVKIK